MPQMTSFQHAIPELRIHYGPDSLRRVAAELDRIGVHRAVVFCGRTLAAPDHPVLAIVREALGARCVGVFPGVRAHSPLHCVEQGAQTLAQLNADAVVSVGGGSAVVTARAASILLAEGGSLEALCTRRTPDGQLTSPRLRADKIPQFIIPTTPTTASVKAGSAVLDPATGRRLALFDTKTRARALFIHPLLALSAPTELVLSASLNALAMAVEGLESAVGDPLADALLMHSLALIGEHLPGLNAAPQDAELRGRLILAALLCGQGTDYTGGGVASALGHTLGSRVDVANGTVNAIVLPHTMRFNAPATAGRLSQITRALGAAAPHGVQVKDESAIAAIDALLAKLHVPRRLRDIGVVRDSLEEVAKEAMNDWFLHRNPRPIAGSAEVLGLLEAAW